jgi:glucan phosphoethanolaminetransferase (alkaline phosphatase superfamily)
VGQALLLKTYAGSRFSANRLKVPVKDSGTSTRDRKISQMKSLIRRFHNHITIAKIICLVLLFSPLWGLWWFNVDPDRVGPDFVLPILRWYLLVKSIPITIVYTSVCLFAFMSFVIIPFIRPRIVRVPLILVMLVGWAFELSILDLSGIVSNQDLLWVMWKESATAPEAIVGYAPYIIRDCAVVTILGIVLGASPARRFNVSGIFGLLPIMSGALVAGVTLYTKGGTQVFPIPFGTFSNTAIVLANLGNIERNRPFFDPVLLRDVVMNSDAKIEGAIHPIFNKLVIIMDESVRGDSVSLNDASLNTTPFLRTTDNLINFGVAISGGNCSYISRTMFRFGMRQSDLPNGWRRGLSRPTIWQFAHRAGYKTVHIDASFHNELASVEKTLVDSNITIFENPEYLRDQKLVDKLVDVLKAEEAEFIYVEKYGVHFPYSSKYPPDFHPFPTPALNTSNQQTAVVGPIEALLTSFLSPARTGQNVDQEIAKYPNAIAWSVDEFFRNLLPAVDLSKTLIIYTSDHGQSLLPGHSTHCSTTPNAPVTEADVPLFAVTSVPEFKRRLENGATGHFGRFSHFEVFPTLLLAMGFDRDWVSGTYGPSLMDSPSLDRKFMIGSPDFQPIVISVDRNFRFGSPENLGPR